jgi:hypothetical protein
MATFSFQDLQSEDENIFNQAWGQFFLSTDLVRRFLRASTVEDVHATLNAGYRWAGYGWNTTKAAVETRKLSGVVLVSAKLQDYSHAFLFSIALTKGVEINQMELSSASGEAAFEMAKLWSTNLEDTESSTTKLADPKDKERIPKADDVAMDTEEEDEETGAEERLPWQEEETPLPPSLAKCVQSATTGGRLPWKAVLATVPVYAGLKARAEDNNHAGDSKSGMDRLLKGFQQKQLNVLRMIACLQEGVQGQDYQVLHQQLFFAVLEVEQQLMRERKKRSIPGSVPLTTNGLFSKEDLAVDKQQQQINSAPGAKFGRWKGGKGWGKGKGYGSLNAFQPWRQKYAQQSQQLSSSLCLPSTGVALAKGKRSGEAHHSNDTTGERCTVTHLHSAMSLSQVAAVKSNGAEQVSVSMTPSGNVTPAKRLQAGNVLPAVPVPMIMTETSAVPTPVIKPGNSDNPAAAPMCSLVSSSVISSDSVGGPEGSPCHSFRAFLGTTSDQCGIRVGGHPTVAKVAEKPVLVGRKLFPICNQVNQGRCRARPTPTPPNVQKKTSENPTGGTPGSKHHAGLPKKWGSQKSARPRKYKAFSTLVHHQQDRGYKHKTPSNLRLQRTKSVLHPPKVHFGKHVYHFPSPKEGMVVCKTRPEGCILPL